MADAEQFHAQYPVLQALVVALPGGDVGGPGGLDPSPDSDHLILRDSTGVVVDAMSWGSDTTAFAPACPTVAAGHSLEREPAGRDTDSAADFVDRFPPTPGGWRESAHWLTLDRRLPATEATRDLFFVDIATPLEVLRSSLGALAMSLFLAILMAIVFGACSTILDNTVREHETSLGELLGRLPIIGPALRGLGAALNAATPLRRLGSLPLLLVVLAIYALLFCLLDESWRLTRPGGLFMFGSMLVTSAFIGFADTLAQGMWVRRWGMRPKMQFWPFNLGVAGGAVAISRLVALQPGLLFGAPGGLDYGDAELDEQRERTLLKVGLLALGALGVVAWVAGWLANQSSLALAARGFEETPALLVGLRNVLLLLFYGALGSRLLPDDAFCQYLWPQGAAHQQARVGHSVHPHRVAAGAADVQSGKQPVGSLPATAGAGAAPLHGRPHRLHHFRLSILSQAGFQPPTGGRVRAGTYVVKVTLPDRFLGYN